MTTGTGVNNKSITCKAHFNKRRARVSLACLSEVFSELEGVSILGGNNARKDMGRFSYWAAGPKEIFEFRAFTRLKQLEYLIRTGQIDDEFFWKF